MTVALVVDDHPLARRGISAILQDDVGIETIHEADNAHLAIGLARQVRPDLVMMDLQMPESLPPRELCGQLRAAVPDAAIVVLTAFNRGVEVHACLEAGANGCLLKDSPEAELAGSIREIMAGTVVIDPRAANQLAMTLASRAGHRGVHLTAREHEVLRELAEGRSNRQIAGRLLISEATVKGYVGALMEKLHASSRLEAVVRAGRAGLL